MKKSKLIRKQRKSLIDCHLEQMNMLNTIGHLDLRNLELEQTLAKVRKDLEEQANTMIKDTETLKKELARALELLNTTTQIAEIVRIVEKVYNAL